MIVLAGGDGRPSSWSWSGFGGIFGAFEPLLAAGEWPVCHGFARENPRGLVTLDPEQRCVSCPLAVPHRNNVEADAVCHSSRPVKSR